MSCKTGELFNGDVCVDERFYSCPNLDSDSCDTKENGYYKDNNLDCRSYFYCSSNRKYSFLCQDGQAFDGNKCVSKRHVEPCSKSSDCTGRSDGYYQDLKSGCSKYFYCKQNDKVQVRNKLPKKNLCGSQTNDIIFKLRGKLIIEGKTQLFFFSLESFYNLLHLFFGI